MEKGEPMNNPVEPTSWEEVLDAYVAEAEMPNHALMMEWIRRYPQYRQELVDFTVTRSRLANSTPVEHEGIDEERLILRGMSIVQNLLHERSKNEAAPAHTERPIGSFVSEARWLQWSPDALAARLELSGTLLAKLDRRLIEHLTIPMQLIENLALTLKRDVISILRYLGQDSTLALGARYKATQAPQVPEKMSFFDAVRNDPELSDEQRQHWLALESPTG